MKNLLLLEQDYKEVLSDIEDLEQKIENLEIKIGVSAKPFSDIKVDTSISPDADSLLLSYIEYKIKLDLKKKRKIQLDDQINFYYELYKQSSNENEMIYIEKMIKHYSNAKISVLHNGIAKATINRKIDLVKKHYLKNLNFEKSIEEEIRLSATKVFKDLQKLE